jgi:hypothetical protein
MQDDGDEDDGFYKAESLRILNPFWMQLRSHELRECGYSWEEIGKALSRHPSTIQNYFRAAERELVYQDTIHFFLSEKTSKLLQKLGVDTMSFSGAEMARLAARSYYDGGTVRGIGPATAKEILDAIEDLYECRANRERVAGS